VTALLWAAVLWISAQPVHERLLSLAGGRRSLAAGMMTLLVMLVLLLPFVIVGVGAADNARALTLATRGWLGDAANGPPPWLSGLPFVGETIRTYWIELAGDSGRLLAEAQRFVEPASTWLLGRGVALGQGLAELGLSIAIAFFFFRDGVMLRSRIQAAVQQIAGPRGDHLLELAIGTVRSVVNGILGTALVQGVLAGIGFLIAGVPGATLLGLLTFFVSIIPMGPPLIWIPAVIWLYQQGDSGWAIFMGVWGVGVSSVDNFVKPWLISQGSTLPFILIFFGVIGGALGFGFVGVFLGPTLLALGFRIIQDWAVVREAAVLAAAAETPAGASGDAG